MGVVRAYVVKWGTRVHAHARVHVRETHERTTSRSPSTAGVHDHGAEMAEHMGVRVHV